MRQHALLSVLSPRNYAGVRAGPSPAAYPQFEDGHPPRQLLPPPPSLLSPYGYIHAYLDVLGVHAAGYKAPPEVDPGEVARNPGFYNLGDPNCPGDLCRIYCFRHVEDLRKVMVGNGDAHKQVAVLEFGWTTDPRSDSPYHWHAVSEEQQADYLVRAYRYAKEHWAPWIGLMSLIYIANPDWTKKDEQYWWATTYPNCPVTSVTKVRPAYTALKEMPK